MNKGFNHTDNEKKYADIFNMSRPVSKAYPQISIEERAAQFGSFDALVGLDDEMDETARITEQPSNLSEDQKAEINEKLTLLNACAEVAPPIKVTYFVSDERKKGGMYVSATGRFKRYDEYERCIVINERTNIPIETVVAIDPVMFD